MAFTLIHKTVIEYLDHANPAYFPERAPESFVIKNNLLQKYFSAMPPPVCQALLDWFPDKKGLASGLVIAGFGSGALFFTPAVNALQQKFLEMPTYLGKTVETVTEGGKMFAKVSIRSSGFD